MKNISKKFIAIISLIAMISSIVPSSTTNALTWDRQKAEHLARRALIGATPEQINNLYNAGSADSAVELLFPSLTGPDRTNYESIMSSLTSSSGFTNTTSTSMNKYYQMKNYYDPYEAKAKFFEVFEDTLASGIDSGRKINYIDIENTHKLIYKYMFGSYKDLIKNIVYTNGQELGDFTEGAYLDLFNQTNKRYPNENYARELLQLFLMSEYKPNESKDLGSLRNYEESDVASLAKILFGYKTDSNNIVSYENPSYTGSDIRNVEFLTGSFKSGDETRFNSFYNSASGTISLESIQSGGGLNLRNNAVDYIFSKRENEIALFMANKIFKFYVFDNPSSSDLQTFANIIKQNDFKMFESVKWLLKSDMMYTEESMNELRYKTPIELAIGSLKLLNQNDKNYIDSAIQNTSLLSNLGWNPFSQDSIFGRDGFDKNENFYNANLHNKWISFTSNLVYSSSSRLTSPYNLLPYTSTGVTTYTDFSTINPILLDSKTLLGTGTITYLSGSTSKNYTFTSSNFDLASQKLKTNLGDILVDFTGYTQSGNISISFSSGTLTTTGGIYPITSATFSPKTPGIMERSLTPDETISFLEQKLSFGSLIDSATRTQLIDFLNKDEKGNSIIFDSTRDKEKIESLTSIMMTLPEFVLNSGFNSVSQSETESSFLNGVNSKIVFVNLGGGYDYLYNFFPKKNEEVLKTLRPTLYRKTNEIVSIDSNYYMSNSIAYGSGGTNGLKSVFDSDNLRIFNRVGSVGHSRDHDQAGRSMQSINSYTTTNVDGLFGRLIKNDIPTNTMVVGSNSKPFALKNGKYVNIGAGGNILTNSKLSTDKKNQVLNAIRNIGQTKSYPSNTSGVFKDAITIDAIGTTAKNNIGRDGAGWGNSQNYDFIKTMMNNNYGKAYYMYGDGGYDTHDKQAASLDTNINKVVTSMTKFFDEVKTTQDVTIVMFSEFGRTIKENAGTDGAGTDHGKAGVVWVMTNNSNLKTLLPQKIYGDLDVTKEKEDLLGVGIYYDSIYDKIFNALYSVSGMFQHNLSDELSTATPVITNLNNELKANYSNYNTTVSFDIDSPNFSATAAGNVSIKYGKDFSSLGSPISNWETWQSSNPIVKGNKVKFTKSISGTGFAYEIKVMNNQYSEKIFSGIIDNSPYKTGSLVISDNKDSFLTTFTNKIINGEETLANKILLGQTTGTGVTEKILTKGNSIRLILGTGATNIEKLSGSGIWNGRFVLGDILDKSYIFSSGAITSSGEKLREMNIEKLFKIGADTLGVGMKLDRNIDIEVSGLTASTKYKVLSSEDLINWQTHTSGIYSDNTGKLRFSTNHFTYFTVIPDVPDDITPDGFSFSPLVSKELSTSYESNTITVSGINKAVNISITGGGEYNINGGGYTSSTGTVVSGDIVKVRLTSSSNYNTTLSTTLNISGVISSFTVSTKTDPTVITTPVTPPSTGGGGGGGGGLTRDYCPSGDLSPSYYDRSCDAKNSNSVSNSQNTNSSNSGIVIKNTKTNLPAKSVIDFTPLQKYITSRKDNYNAKRYLIFINQLRLKTKLLAKRKGFNQVKVEEVLKKFEEEVRGVSN